ncbi:MAG: GNAT family N-acyltransferase [Desulfuromonadales bacterium]|nr:GNAT family N-acyltransferase [Desulfuromonadales bacterium]
MISIQQDSWPEQPVTVAGARFRQLLQRVAAAPLEWGFGLKACRERYRSLAAPSDAAGFAERALESLAVRWTTRGAPLHEIPERGATVVVANHPFGGVEGLVLIALLRRLRPDVKVLANPFLWQIPELREALIPIDPMQSRRARQHNVGPVRAACRWLDAGGLLVVFPAGTVSHLQLRGRTVADPPWQEGVVALIARSAAAVVPVFFPGGNGPLFQLAGMVHPRLRTLLLARQLLNKQGQQIEVCIGRHIEARRLQQLGSPTEQLNYLRLRTYLLADAHEPVATHTPGPPTLPAAPAPLAAAASRSDLRREIAALPESALLLQNGSRQVFCIACEQAPAVLYEIGRLREETFRRHGEGTGRSLDLDYFDSHYLHLFLWEAEREEVIGAYRIGLAGPIVRQLGVSGLYTSTLFRIDPQLFAELSPALELGRSFIRHDYQKSYAPLLLLWQGIGRFLVRHPGYRTLFGPVSISADYSDFSRQLITRTLHEHLRLPGLARYVEPRQPVPAGLPRVKGCPVDLTRGFTRSIETMAALVADLDSDLNGIPVLLRHYMNLGGRMLAFNRDPAFSDVIDGLIVVDLDRTDARTLKRYMGADGAADFLAHGRPEHLSRVA